MAKRVDIKFVIKIIAVESAILEVIVIEKNVKYTKIALIEQDITAA